MTEYQHMNQILPGLWVGDIQSTKDVDSLRENNIHSILTAMRGKISIHETFLRHQILLDDTADADILQHLVPAITFIDAEIQKGRGVLVHCQAGMSQPGHEMEIPENLSYPNIAWWNDNRFYPLRRKHSNQVVTGRSATIAAAYVMYHKNVDVQTALAIIREGRPTAQPNEGFLAQLEIFHQASFKVSKRDKATRMFYLERAVEEILNGDGSVETDMFAKFPRTPSGSTPATPGGPRRRIRCKMCRTELATREHMFDHGQLGPPTPAVALSPAMSRRPSSSAGVRRASQPRSRHNSSGARRPSIEGGVFAGLAASLTMSALETDDEDDGAKSKPAPRTNSKPPSRRPSVGAGARSPRGSTSSPRLSESRQRRPSIPGLTALSSISMSMSAVDSDDDEPMPALKTVPANGSAAPVKAPTAESEQAGATSTSLPHVPSVATGGLQSPADLAAQLYANPKLAALRGPMGMGMTPIQTNGVRPDKASISPPILANPKCSGYFVEPMEWMTFFLEDGQLAGKITCPNKKCNAKLGNYDWAGVCCGCKEWVVPGFCINRSKVDEIVV